jgi:small GTP-binding protein
MSQPRARVVFLGDAGVGKSSILKWKKSQSFDYQIESTIGADHARVLTEVDGNSIDLLVWDTAGQERYRSVTPHYLRDAHVAVVVGSLTDYLSIESLKTSWVDLARTVDSNMKLIGVVNKIDLQPPERLGETDTLRNEVLSGGDFNSVYLVSALTGQGIDELFQAMAEIALREVSQAPLSARPLVEINARSSEGSCC